MNKRWLFSGCLFLALTGASTTTVAEWLAGRVGHVNVSAGEIEIDGIRFKVSRQSRDQAGQRVLLSRFQSGDGALFRPGVNQTLLGLEKPTGGLDLPQTRMRTPQ